ncbi:AAA family ATPase [Daejeonella oryzae]|uniref:AAA family ATPase n=1 Tax=Daejeonella oryzae TaxID=1122943 RepID=UPI0003F9AF4F|nr:AAA family ATPase [Daejeonella oryzae]
MINSIEIKNFRSIQECNVKLKPLTVIVGANSTGKSNLIKGIDFISDIAQFGLVDAIYNRGGFNEILPKQYKDLNNKEILFKLEFKIDPPQDWSEAYGELKVTYLLKIKKLKTNDIKILQEELFVDSVFLLADHLEKMNSNENKKITPLKYEQLEKYKESSIKFFRNNKGVVTYETNFELNNENTKLLLHWIGLGGLVGEDLNSKRVNALLNTILNNVKNTSSKNNQTTLISSDRHIINFSQHLRKIVSELQSISRYDLFINELRQEQSISNSNKVSTSGDNIPTVVKKFIKNNKKAWNRIVDTMFNISPYFTKAYAETLRAGKEYLVFEEIFDGRPIESWEASDGTLRALAILLCLESHSEGSTILIEEPEHGLHPWAVKDLMSHIRNTIEIKKIQVILTTHSQQVLECLKPDELLITERDENGTHYMTIGDIVNIENISMGEVGSLWTKGLLNGVPKTI